MNRISPVAIALMITITTMGTGSLGKDDTNDNIFVTNSVALDGTNDTIDRTNTFPFDVLFDDYYDTSAEVYADLLTFQTNHPDIIELYTLTDIIPAGQTWQGNEVYGIKISDNVANEPAFYDDPDEETYFIVSNHHSREWMTVPTAMYFIYYLTHFYGMEPTDNDGDGLSNEEETESEVNDDFLHTNHTNKIFA